MKHNFLTSIKRISLMIALLTYTASCETSISGLEERIDSKVVSGGGEKEIVTHSATAPYVLSALVSGASCGAPSYGTQYSLYATVYPVVNYDKFVHVGLVQNNAIIESKILKVPAGSSRSISVPVFMTRPVSGMVDVVIYNVTNAQGMIDYSSERRSTSMSNVRNCLTTPPKLSCGAQGMVDTNGDGICEDALDPNP